MLLDCSSDVNKTFCQNQNRYFLYTKTKDQDFSAGSSSPTPTEHGKIYFECYQPL